MRSESKRREVGCKSDENPHCPLTNVSFSDMDLNFVEAPLLKPSEVTIDAGLMAKYQEELTKAQVASLPEDDDDDL
jgi:GTP-binding nuclear protein Ran